MSAFLELPPIKLVHVDRKTLPPASELPPPLEIGFPLDDTRTFLSLPRIGGPVSALHTPHVAETTNPGTFNPRSQNLARHVSVDQTMSVTSLSGPRINSDGQVQLKDNGGVGQRGVTVTAGYDHLQNSDGNVQLPNISPQDRGISSDQRPGGLPQDARPDSQNLTKMTRVTAVPLPVATNVRAGDSKPGKLPITHIIK